jgi:uncharacterized protein (TIGR02421 family)
MTKRKRRLTTEEAIPQQLINRVCQRLARNLRVRRTLPQNGRLHIDRQLPFLCVYRRLSDHEDAGTERLVKGEASYLIAPGGSGFRPSVARLVHRVVETLSGEFGAFLIVEIWAAPDGGKANDPAVPTVLPTFTIHAPANAAMDRVVEVMARQLKRVKILKQGVEVDIVRGGRACAPAQRPLLTAAQAHELNCTFMGVTVPPVYRKPNSTAEFPVVARLLRQGLSLALRPTYFEFARTFTTHRPPHYHALGRKAVVKAVWKVDHQLAAVSNQFDYLLQLTPVNASRAWKQFQRDQFQRVPEFHYRPLPIDPAVSKRELYRIPIERIEDPALQRLFQEKQQELELKLTMLRDRDTAKFLYESLQLFGGVEDDLLQLAIGLLRQVSCKGGGRKGRPVHAAAFARHVETEFDYYRQHCPEFKARVKVTDDVSGLIVLRGQLLINADLSIPKTRIKALLAHEVGTHLLTYFNGRQQPFQQLYAGLAGYEELQEGLAVLAEYLVGGLSHSRMRQLAARVLAVHHLTEGASFIDTFRSLEREYGFTQQAAYKITMRVYRGGGLTKDAIYLRGLQAILKYVKKRGGLEPLLVGKMAVEHIPIIKELQYRKVLQAAPILPRYLQDANALKRLKGLGGSRCSVMDLVCDRPMKMTGAG